MNDFNQFHCKDSSNHANKWYFLLPSDNNETVCLACSALALEDKNLLNVRKKIILCMLHEILHSSPQLIMNILQNKDEVFLHISIVLLSLCCEGVELLVKPASDCLLLFLIHAKKEDLRLAVAQKLTVEIQKELNYLRCLPHFTLLGRFLQLFPALISEFMSHNSQLLYFLAKGMTHQSEDIHSTAIYIFIQIYSSNSNIDNGITDAIDSLVSKGILCVLKSALSKDVIKNGLALLKVFIGQDSKRTTLLFDNLNEDANFLTVLKKIILTSDAAFQVCITQCICYIITEPSSAEMYLRMLIEGNVPELLFEVISGSNELLLETILCCLHLFSHSPYFYEKCHVLYSVTTIVDLAVRLLKLKNMKLLCLAFNLLISLICSNQYLMAASAQTSFFQQALMLIENAYKVHNPHILHVTNKLLYYLLKKESHPSPKFPLPLSQIFGILNVCLKNMKRFLSSHVLSTSQLKDNFESSMENLPLEVKILTSGLDVVYLFIRILKQNDINTMSMEEIYSCPAIENDESPKSTTNINLQSLMQNFIIALDEIFVPCCLVLGSDSIAGKICWCHLINVISSVFENTTNDPMLLQFAQKLIKSRILTHVWNIKMDEMLSFDDFDDSKEVCNRCLRNTLKFLLESHKVCKSHLDCIESGVALMNCSIEESCSILSMRSESQIQNSEHLYSIQFTFLCMVYFSYLYEGPIVKMKNLIPHLIYYVTCNLDRFNSSIVIVKHLIFILAVCMHENVNKFETGLIEVSGMVWDILSKITAPKEVYTHHKLLLWWCFENQQVNLFSSYVLQVWLEFSLHTTDPFLSFQAFKILINLLSTNEAAQETFVRQFESNPEIRFSFLKKVFESQVFNSDVLIFKERFENLIKACVQYLQILLSKKLVMKNHTDISQDCFLSIGLECLLWCQQKISNSNEVDIKLLFHVTSLCCNSSFPDRTLLASCLRYLQYAVQIQVQDSKAWHIVTGNPNIVTFLQNNITIEASIEIETLHLIVLILEHQTDASLKCNTCMRISLTQILRWMNRPETKVLSLKLVNSLLDVQFKRIFIQIWSLQENNLSFQENLSEKDIRILTLYLQNAIMLGNPVVENVALTSYEKLLKYIASTYPQLERHIMLQPWQRILLESRLEDGYSSRSLFEKWWNYGKENKTLIGVMNQFADRITDMPDFHGNSKMPEFGVYKKFIAKEIMEKLEDLTIPSSSLINNATQETDLISEIENYVSNHISNISSNQKDSVAK